MIDSIITILVSFFPGVRPGFFTGLCGDIFLIGMRLGYDKVVDEEPAAKEKGANMGIYVCSDIHGMYDLYCRMLKTIQFSDSDYLYILGDMIDRGPDGNKILLDVIKRENVTCLIGNHEHMMWHYLNRYGDDFARAWMLPGNGGRKTLTPYTMLLNEDKQAIRHFLDDLYLQVELAVGGKTFLLSHSSFLPDFGTVKWKAPELSEEEVLDVVWCSPWRRWEHIAPEEYRKDGRYHIIGHVPVLLIGDEDWPDDKRPDMPCYYEDKENRLVKIDLGCAFIPAAREGLYDKDRRADGASLCVLNLERFAAGDPDAAIYLS